MQGTMKAARLDKPDDPQGLNLVVRVDEVPIPDIRRDEVLVRVLRAGLNHGDVHLREEGLGFIQYASAVNMLPHLPMTIGHDGMGEVAEVGPEVEGVRVGDRVVVMPAITCGYCKYCRSDREHLCLTHRIMGYVAKSGERGSQQHIRYKDGLWAEYCRVPAGNVSPLRPEDDFAEMCKVSQIAVGYRVLKRARLHSGETLLINGGTGITGIGTVLGALAMGAAHIIVVARNAARLERVRAMAPQRISTVTLSRGESITERVRELTGGQGAAVVVDLVGPPSLVECIMNLEPGGRVALIAGSPEPLNVPTRYLMVRNIEFTSITGRHYADFPELMEMARRGLIDTSHITTRLFPMEAVNEALDYIEARGENDPLWPMYAPPS